MPRQLDQSGRAKHHHLDPRKQAPDGRHQIGTPAGFRSERWPASYRNAWAACGGRHKKASRVAPAVHKAHWRFGLVRNATLSTRPAQLAPRVCATKRARRRPSDRHDLRPAAPGPTPALRPRPSNPHRFAPYQSPSSPRLALSEQRQVVCVGRSTGRPKRRLGREGAPLGQRGGAPLFVNLAGDEMALLIEMVVDLGMN